MPPLSAVLPIALISLVFGGLALGMGIRFWRGTSERAQAGAVRNNPPQFSTPGIGAFVILPWMGTAFTALGLAVLSLAAPLDVARPLFVLLGGTGLVAAFGGLVLAMVSEHQSYPVAAPQWFRAAHPRPGDE